MRKDDYPSYVHLVSWLYCAFISRHVLHDWMSFPLLYGSDLAFFFWLIPVLVYWFYPWGTKKKQINLPFLALGIIFSTLGLLGDLNVIKNIGLILATGALFPVTWRQLFWLVSAIVWLPAYGYLLRNFPISFVIGSRLVIAFLGALIGIWLLFYEKRLTWSNDEHKD